MIPNQPTRVWRFPPVGIVLLLLAVMISIPAFALPAGESYGVYVRLGDAPSGSLSATASGLETAFRDSDWHLLAAYDAGVDKDDCSYQARVLVVNNDEYAAAVLSHGPLAAFALPVRLAVWEDEAGVHVGLANPESLTRTMIAEQGFEQQATDVVAAIGRIVQQVSGVSAASAQYGQMRDVGLISKTMGIMAGGPFPGKVEKVASAKGDVAAVAEQLVAGIRKLAADWKWKIHPVYSLDLSAHGIAIVGVTSDSVESRSFGIVGEGTDSSRSDYACPGIDHAAAYPIELVLAQDGDTVKISMIDEMFRMKIYFEDAGKMAFALNMRMPGSIENEIRDKVEESIR